MSAKNVEIVRQVVETFQVAKARDEPEAIFDGGLVAADLEWMPFAGFPGPAVYRGREGFVEFWRVWTEDFADWTFRIERLVDAGNSGLSHCSTSRQSEEKVACRSNCISARSTT